MAKWDTYSQLTNLVGNLEFLVRDSGVVLTENQIQRLIGLTFLTKSISPAQITADQDNYNPAGLTSASVLRLSTDVSRNITGLTGGVKDRMLAIINVGSNSIVLKNENASSIAGNRFALDADLTLAAAQACIVWYDITSSRWMCLSATSQRVDAIKIIGMKLIWNSATSISVDVGSCYAQNSDFIKATSVLTASGLSLSASTWYHAYVYLSAGAPAVEVVVNGPTQWKSDAYSKTGNTSRRYVGSIKTDASGNIYKFTHSADTNYVAYEKFSSDVLPFRVLPGGVATTPTAVSLSGIIPITSFLALVRFTNTADMPLFSSDDGGVSSTQNTLALSVGNVSAQSAFATHPLDASQQFWYAYPAAPTTGAAYLDVLGYYFNR